MAKSKRTKGVTMIYKTQSLWDYGLTFAFCVLSVVIAIVSALKKMSHDKSARLKVYKMYWMK